MERFKVFSNLIAGGMWDETPSGCWEWNRNKSGEYGQLHARVGEKYTTMSASRAMLMKTLGRPLGKGMLACHTCDNPPCVNPEHLYEGTSKQNTQDMIQRGRRNESHVKGGEATRVLTLEQALEVRRLASEGVYYQEIQDRFGVSRQTVSDIVVGKNYGFNGVDARGDRVEELSRRARRGLEDWQVIRIREMVEDGWTYAQITEEFGDTWRIDTSKISRIITGKLYKNVK